MTFLDRIREKPRSVRLAITWGVGVLVIAIVLPLWLASLSAANGARRRGASGDAPSGEGAIGLFFNSAGGDVAGQLKEATATIGELFRELRDGTLTSERQILESPDGASPDDESRVEDSSGVREEIREPSYLPQP